MGECVGICVCEAFPWQPVRGVFGPGRGREKDETRRKLSLVKGWGGNEIS